ncbi:MAG: NAD(P)/FAD-dependent oxidoreductase [Chloroflexota bacterium]|nr:NAD(P)/FAD-dependent oxidoreductase [Chloroflexota bacterium]
MSVPVETTDVLLIGGGVASVRCARTLRREGFDGRIVLVGDEPIAPYNRPPLSKELLRDDLADDLALAEPASWYERRRVELRTGRSVTALDLGTREVALDDGARIRFERCLLATGAEPRHLQVPGAGEALPLRTLRDARRIRAAAIAAGRDAPVVVVGAGFIGLEVASSLAHLGLHPTVVGRGNRLWSGAMGSSIAAWAAEALAAAGVTIRLDAAVTRLDPGAAWIGEERLEAAFVVAGIGVRPRVEIGVTAGLHVNGGVVTDAGHRSSHASVWAAGDVARRDGRRIEHWHAARDGGERAARSMLGLDLGPDRPPWVFSDVAGTMLDIVGSTDEGWDEERWVVPSRVAAQVRQGRVVQVISLGSAMTVDVMRRAVGEQLSLEQLARLAEAQS